MNMIRSAKNQIAELTAAAYRAAVQVYQGWLRYVARPHGSGGSRKYLLASLDQSLKRMGLEYVDIFYSSRR